MGSGVERQTPAGAGGEARQKEAAHSAPLIQAIFSPCRFYRYHWEAFWNPAFAPLHFLLLNPSTADEIKSDPTVERCLRRARITGYGGVIITNIFGWRSTDPRGLNEPADAVGAENNQHIRAAAIRAARTVCGWGSAGPKLLMRRRIPEVRQMLDSHTLWCLGLNTDGQPKHPLYIGYEEQLRVWKYAHE